MDLLHIELREAIKSLCAVSFSPYFPTGFEGVLTAYPTILLTFFPQGFWRRFKQDDGSLYSEVVIRGSVKNN
jgi:hypothetical protein